MFGFSKNNKHNEVQVVMGLLIDNNGLPITFQLFPGNTMDQKTLQDAVTELKRKYNLDKIIIVADRGLNGGENLNYLVEEKHDFVVGYSIKRSSSALKQMALDKSGWKTTQRDEDGSVLFMQKILEHTTQVRVELTEAEISAQPKKSGRKSKYKTVQIPVKLHLTWSKKRADKDYADRNRLLAKTRKVLETPGLIKANMQRGKNQYINFELDSDKCTLDEDKIAQQEQFDGHYAVATNNLELSTERVCELYRGLWQIEESFRVLKTDIRACPVFVWNDERIIGHFVLCFMALCFVRYTQYLLHQKGKQVSAAVLKDALYEPLVLVLGAFPNSMLIPANVSQIYLDLAEILKLPPLRVSMQPSQFRNSTKLDIKLNLTK